MKKSFIFILLTLVAILCLFYLDTVNGAPKRKSGGSRRKSSSGGGWFGGSSKKKNYNYGSGGGGNYKKKSKVGSTLKKAAVIGAVAYGSYQIGKLSGRFSGYGGYGGHRYGFNDWNRWREIDGFMCRNTGDCSWMDSRLYCQDYELDFTPSALWFGGDAARIVGECACPQGMVWDDYEMECESNFFSGFYIFGLIVTAILIGCCCCAGVFLFRRFS